MNRTIGEIIEHCKAQGDKLPDACYKCKYYNPRKGCAFYSHPSGWERYLKEVMRSEAD